MSQEKSSRDLAVIRIIAEELGIKNWQTEAAVKLIDEGNTIPFIARYRKEATGELNDEVLRNLGERLAYLRNLDERRATIIASIEEQGKLTDELKAQIEEATTMVSLEDLYRPYKPKRRTRATIAKEKGLEGLANLIMLQQMDKPAEEYARDFISEEKGVNSVQEAIDGAKDIIAEVVSDDAAVRDFIRNITYKEGILTCEAKDDKVESVYEMYYRFEEPVRKLAGHRILAINRGEKEKILTVKIASPEERILNYMNRNYIRKDNRFTTPLLTEAIKDSYDRLIAPSIERDIRNTLTEGAEDGAISVFGKNLTQLLMQPPIAGKTVLGWDPAFRTGCKLAVCDATGKVLDTKVIFPTAPQNRVEESLEELKKLIKKYNVDIISVGNGTASRESEAVIVRLIKEIKTPLSYVIVNEAGASVYSASKLATEEFPNFDVGQRSAASIARRLQDPLAELVKIDPKSIGVGQYQHDCDGKKLEDALSGVVEASVNRVGVDLNTASFSLLSYVAGINKTLAKNIVSYREKNGRFTNRKQLLNVEKLGPKAFTQCAGFLRITGGDNPLDATGVHPESYDATKKLLGKLGVSVESIITGSKESGAVAGSKGAGAVAGSKSPGAGVAALYKLVTDKKKLAEELGIGLITLEDIVKELEKPGRDPREEGPAPILKSDIMEFKDLKAGMILKGTVRNVIDFGAFVDIGVHQDGLVHISQMSTGFIKHPLEVVSVGDIVEVKILEVDEKKKRIALSMLVN